MKKPCLTCGALNRGSYCTHHQPWRPRGRVNRQLRAHVFAVYGRRCRDCGRSDVALEVHHVNGDPTDNRIRNLIPLCRGCHRLATFPHIPRPSRPRSLPARGDPALTDEFGP